MLTRVAHARQKKVLATVQRKIVRVVKKGYMESAFLYFLLLILLVVGVINLILAVSLSMVSIKMYEILKVHDEKMKLDEEAKLRARGLIDLPNAVPYDVPMR